MTGLVCIFEKDLCERFGISPRTVQRWRETGDGPPFIRFGKRRLAYLLADVNAWVAARTFAHNAAEIAHTPIKSDAPALPPLSRSPPPPPPPPPPLPTYEEGRCDAFLEAADMCVQSQAAIRLAAGEMTAQEMRTAQAVLRWRAAAMRKMAEKT